MFTDMIQGHKTRLHGCWKGEEPRGAQKDTESWNGMKLERKIRQVSDSVFYWLKTGGLLSMLWAVFMAGDVLARRMHEKERGKQVNFRHTRPRNAMEI